MTLYFENIAGKAGDTARLLRLVDRNGNTLRMNYNGDKLASVQDDLNRHLTFHYDNNDLHITRITDWSGRTFRYIYDNNNLVRFDSPLAVEGQIDSTTYEYYTAADGTNLDHAMRSFTRPTGYSMAFEYYTNGKTFRHTDSLGQSFTFRYNTFRRETTTMDERGISQTYLFNSPRGSSLAFCPYDQTNSRIMLGKSKRQDPCPPSVAQAFDALGWPEKLATDRFYTRQRQYDTNNRPTRAFDEHGQTVSTNHDMVSQPTKTNGSAHYQTRRSRKNTVESETAAKQVPPMNYQDYIEITPGKRSDKPCIKQTRITVYDVLGWLAQGMTVPDILADYPELNATQIQACLAYAAEREHHLISVSAA